MKYLLVDYFHSLCSQSPYEDLAQLLRPADSPRCQLHHAPCWGNWENGLFSAFCHTASLKLGKRTVCTWNQPDGSNFSNSHFYSKLSVHLNTQEGACQANVQRKTMRKRAMPCLSLDTHFSFITRNWKTHTCHNPFLRLQ